MPPSGFTKSIKTTWFNSNLVLHTGLNTEAVNSAHRKRVSKQDAGKNSPDAL